MTKTASSEASIWYARAEQAERIASMLPHDTELVLAYGRECGDSVRAALAPLRMIRDALNDSRQRSERLQPPSATLILFKFFLLLQSHCIPVCASNCITQF